jgi:hypothetical protein
MVAKGVFYHRVLWGMLCLILGVGVGYALSWQYKHKMMEQQQSVANMQHQLVQMGRIISFHQRFRSILHIENSEKLGQFGLFTGFTTGTVRLLLVVYYDVLAGMDLQQGFSMRWDDDTQELVVYCPEAQIFEVNADHKNIEQLVHFSRWRVVSLQDFLPAIAHHRTQVTEDALTLGILPKAASAAQKLLRQLLAEQGWHQVRFEEAS